MEEIRLYNQLRLTVYPVIYRVLYIPGGAGCLPSTVWFVFGENRIIPNDGSLVDREERNSKGNADLGNVWI